MSLHLVQDPAYHLFADGRTLLGIANAADTLSNLGLVLAGTLGLLFLCHEATRPGSRTFFAPGERLAWAILFSAIVLTGAGSAWYHMAPDDARLVWDRLPMSLGFSALLAITIAERLSIARGLQLLLPLLLTGAASVLWWRQTGNLAPYAAVQFGSLGIVLAIVIKYRSRYSHGRYMFGVLAMYAAAKAAEALDGPIFGLGGFISGHTLKHLLAAGGVLCLLRMLELRGPENAR